MTRPLRVLHVSQPVDGGVAGVVRTLCADQHDRGWDVRLACPDGPLADAARAAGVPVETWAATRSPGRSVPAEVRALARIVARTAPDVVHLHSSKAGLAGRLAVRGRVPTVVQPHAWSFDAVAGPVARAARTWERVAARWTSLLLCVSADELATGRAAGIGGAAVVVPNGVDLDRFTAAGPDDARTALGLGPGPWALCLGRVTAQKGQDLLLDAWPSVRAQVPGARLLVVGDGPDAATLGERCAADPLLRDSVLLHPATTDPAPYHRAADVVVLPSRWEGMPLVALEAMASGRPVVGFAVTGMAEAVGPAGRTVPPGDVPALADAVALRLAAPDLAAGEGRAARARAEELFDRTRVTARVAALVAELAGREWPTSSSPEAAPGNGSTAGSDSGVAG
ncbi:glycosyltransferase [Pseudonocardia sp. ICBG162]|uniref:glycosyltransferase n=1 Tax=Pseudonocardia sp. ICBG162 TaxID=2846761 RepID=UPI001CF68A09|nr:glycosyltransferase [Pseudonocardia sp. ICBG162]